MVDKMLKYFEENYNVFSRFDGYIDSFIFDSEVFKYIDVLMAIVNDYYAKSIVELKNYANEKAQMQILKDKEGKCFLKIIGRNNKTIIILRQNDSNFDAYKNIIGTKYTEEEFSKTVSRLQEMDFNKYKENIPKRFLKEIPSKFDLMTFFNARLLVSYYQYLTEEYSKTVIRHEMFNEPNASSISAKEKSDKEKVQSQDRINDIIDYELRKQELLKYEPIQIIMFTGRKTTEKIDAYLYEKEGFLIAVCEPYLGDSYTKIFNLGNISKDDYPLIKDMITAGLEADRVVSGYDPAIIRKSHTSLDTYKLNLKTLFENLEDDKKFKENIEETFKVYR